MEIRQNEQQTNQLKRLKHEYEEEKQRLAEMERQEKLRQLSLEHEIQ